jgi:putative effector of murein hydrolase LrgA (UPF0299 family)
VVVATGTCGRTISISTGMLTSLLSILVAALVLFIVFYIVGIFVKDETIMKIVGIILGLVLLIYSLGQFKMFNVPWLN